MADGGIHAVFVRIAVGRYVCTILLGLRGNKSWNNGDGDINGGGTLDGGFGEGDSRGEIAVNNKSINR